jgi:hypothetical protein
MLSDSMRTLSGHLDTHEILAAKVSLLVPVAGDIWMVRKIQTIEF